MPDPQKLQFLSFFGVLGPLMRALVPEVCFCGSLRGHQADYTLVPSPAPPYMGGPWRSGRGKQLHTDSHTPADPKGSADDGKRNEMEMDVVFRAGGPMGGGLGEGGHEIAPDDGKRLDSLSPAMDVARCGR